MVMFGSGFFGVSVYGRLILVVKGWESRCYDALVLENNKRLMTFG